MVNFKPLGISECSSPWLNIWDSFYFKSIKKQFKFLDVWSQHPEFIPAVHGCLKSDSQEIAVAIMRFSQVSNYSRLTLLLQTNYIHFTTKKGLTALVLQGTMQSRFEFFFATCYSCFIITGCFIIKGFAIFSKLLPCSYMWITAVLRLLDFKTRTFIFHTLNPLKCPC